MVQIYLNAVITVFKMKGKFGIFFPYVISKIGRQIIKETAVFIKVFRKSSGAVDTVVGAINIHAGIFVAQIEKGRKFSLLFQIIFGVRHRIFFCMVIKILKKSSWGSGIDTIPICLAAYAASHLFCQRN